MIKWIRKSSRPVLEERTEGDFIYLTFPALDKLECIKHLFTTRMGGVSEGIYATLNLSYHRGDKKEAVDENFRRVAKVLNRKVEQFVFSVQTHTTNIRKVTLEDSGKGTSHPIDYTDVDGLITNVPGIVLSTFYADCVPLYFVDPVKKAIGLSHSGWRGTVGKIGKKTVESMIEEYGCNPKDMYVAIGPSICVDCYEVSEDVAEEFRKAFPDKEVQSRIIFPKANGKYQLDLWNANYEILKESNIPMEQITISDICTSENADYLFSHRASNGKRGNLGAFLSLNEIIG